MSFRTLSSWPKWTAVLDGIGAAAMPHRDVALCLHEKAGVGDWWAQAVASGSTL